MSDRVEQFIAQAAQSVAVSFTEAVYHACEKCESPIERLLAAALYASDKVGQPILHFMAANTLPDKPPFGDAAFVYPQAKFGRYRADFAFLDATAAKDGTKWRVMIVECDGHDFHERTKQQAQRDKARDRYFQSQGHKVLRFTGSEIWADPTACAEEILNELALEDEWRLRHP